jgi:hypothetical protein
MIIDQFKGYIEGADLTKVPIQNLAYPSKNVLVSKGKIYTRGGLVNDGVVKTVNEATHSEFVWKDALGGQRPIRVHGNTVQVKYNSLWYTIYTGLDSDTTRVFFATWVDGNGSIIKKRLFFVDGSTAIYQWNGAIGEVESATADSVTFATADGTCLQQGFDDASGTNKNILHFIGSAVTANSTEIQDNNPTAQVLEISGTFNTTPVAGDIIIAEPIKFADEISATFDLDFIYSYKNHVIVGNYDSVNLYFSHVSTFNTATGLDFTMPVAGSRTALTPIFMQLDGNITALIARKGILWVSDADDWYKVTKTVEINPYGLWVDVEKLETGENKGALPMAVAKHKGDIIYLGQDYTLQRVTTNEVLGTDDIQLISDDVEALLKRVDMDGVRLYYVERAIYIVCPADSTLLILDMVEGYFQPPQIMPINCMSIISGTKYGHHSAENSTFVMFSGRNDLDTPIEAVIAFGYTHGEGDKKHNFRYKRHTMFGISGRLTVDTKVSVKQYFEEEGAKTDTTFILDGADEDLTFYEIEDDTSWATHPYATRSWGGIDMVVTDLMRTMAFKKFDAVSYFDFRPIMTISGTANEFHLLAWYIDDEFSPRKIGNNLFINN